MHGSRVTWTFAAGLLLLCCSHHGEAQTWTNPPIILTVEGTNVWVQPAQAQNSVRAFPRQVLGVGDRGRTGRRSRTTLRLSDLSVVRVNELSEFEIKPLAEPEAEAEFSLWKGLLYLFHRDRPGKHRFVTPTATAATRGTEFTLEVEEATGRTVLTVLEGEGELSNPLGTIRLGSGEQGVAVPGQQPTKTAVLDAVSIIQWCLYYPGVLDLEEVELDEGTGTALADSLTAYRSGDLLRALEFYPVDRVPASDSERIYLAALLLSVGQVEAAQGWLGRLAGVRGAGNPLAAALNRVVAVVQGRPLEPVTRPQSATGLLAESYAWQARLDLKRALDLARAAVRQSPRFGFGWARVAELEFSEGRTAPALAALETSLELSPRNAQALALKGFLLSARNRTAEALELFEQAIQVDGGLGNAWLGRGLCRIRRGEADAGRFDLQVAATTELQRSLLRSYLGKAFHHAGDIERAEHELDLARALDAGDPTPWLYSALLLQEGNRINSAVRDLERSQELNDNRRVYRSRLLVDQDRAVRGANLAHIYQDAGMTDVSVREAGRAVNADYANHSAHRFLANSFNQLRDIKQVNIRYETAWFTEYLVANLLAPVGAGTLSQAVSQQEYSRLFERDRLGLSSSTEYFSHGEWIQSAAQYGILGGSSYAAEVFYHTDPGLRPNNDLEQLATVLNLKQQLTPQDSVYLRASYYQADSGDVNQYHDQSQANPLLRVREHQEPMLLAGYHREWNPGSHTLFLAGRLHDRFELDNPFMETRFFNHGFGGPVAAVNPLIYEQDYRSELEIYSGELHHLLRLGSHTLVAGGRLQGGEFRTRNQLSDGQVIGLGAINFPINQNVAVNFDRQSLYLYDHWEVWQTLILAAGVSYDRIQFPENHRYAPISKNQDTREQLSPKVGLIFTPGRGTTLRAAWYRSLGGVSLDQSIRLEPSQVVGFNQAYRSLIPESVAGANAAPEFESWAVSLEQKLDTGTYFALAGEILESEVDRQVGIVDFTIPAVPGVPFSVGSARQTLDYRERTLTFTANQLIGERWSLGGQYRISRAELERQFVDLPSSLPGTRSDLAATLQQVDLFALYHHEKGFFSRADALWSEQTNNGYSPGLSGDDFWQFNVEAGWRFAQRHAEVRLALLNVTDQGYRLNPLNLISELPRERTLAVSLRFFF